MEKIVPALKSGKVIVSDRYTLSTVAYQGYGRGIDLGTVDALNKIATSGLKPDLLFVFDIPDKVFAARERLAQKMFGPDRIEREPSAFRKRVNKAYKVLAKKPGAIRIDGGRSIEEIQADIRARVAKLLKK
jgi:dTMP kinase